MDVLLQRYSASAGKAAVSSLLLSELHPEPALLKMTPDVPVGSGASAARCVMCPSSCSAVRFAASDPPAPLPRPFPAPSGLWDSRSGADGSVISLQTYGETQVCNLPRTTGGPVVHTRMCACTHTLTGCNLPGAYGWPGIPLHLSYTKTAQRPLTLPRGVRE